MPLSLIFLHRFLSISFLFHSLSISFAITIVLFILLFESIHTWCGCEESIYGSNLCTFHLNFIFCIKSYSNHYDLICRCFFLLFLIFFVDFFTLKLIKLVWFKWLFIGVRSNNINVAMRKLANFLSGFDYSYSDGWLPSKIYVQA